MMSLKKKLISQVNVGKVSLKTFPTFRRGKRCSLITCSVLCCYIYMQTVTHRTDCKASDLNLA